jgi:hypothetical protein
MITARALLIAAAAMLAAGRGALGIPEPRASLFAAEYRSGDCPKRHAAAAANTPSSQVSAALMP